MPAGMRLVNSGLLLGLAALLVRAQTQIPLTPPSGWNIQSEGEFRQLTPAGLAAGKSLTVYFPPVVVGSEDMDRVREAGERTLTGGQLLRGVTPAVSGRSRGGWQYQFVAGSFTRANLELYGGVAALRRGNEIGYALVIADSAATYQAHAAAITEILNSLGGVSAAPPAAKDSLSGPGIPGVYAGLTRGLSATAAGSTLRDSRSVYVFFPDGTYRFGLPQRGVPSDLAWDRSTISARWGTWSQQAGEVRLARSGYQEAFRVAADILVDARGREWQKLAPFPNGLRFDARFVRADFREPGAPRLVLRADGTFEAGDRFFNAPAALNNVLAATVPEQQLWAAGRGTYEFGEFSVTFRHADGRVFQLAVYTLPGQDPRGPRFLVLGESYLYERE